MYSHLRGRRHQEALAALPPNTVAEGRESEENPVIIEADEEQQQLPLEKPEVTERLRAGKKRARKLRHRMASRYSVDCVYMYFYLRTCIYACYNFELFL